MERGERRENLKEDGDGDEEGDRPAETTVVCRRYRRKMVGEENGGEESKETRKSEHELESWYL